MSEKLPNWNLEDFYLNLKDDQINVDLDIFKKFSESFNEKYKGQIEKYSDSFESIIEEYENGNETGDKLGNYAFLIYATNMNDE
jgi:oligoendopeptidase F